MRPRFALAVTVIMGLTAFAPAPLPRRDRTGNADVLSLKSLGGDWKVLSLVRYGPNATIAYRISAWSVIRIADGRWTFCRAENGAAVPSTTYGLRIDGGKQPATIDFLHPNQQKPHMSGILRRRGDRLEVLYMLNAPVRPDNFEKPPENYYLFTLTK